MALVQWYDGFLFCLLRVGFRPSVRPLFARAAPETLTGSPPIPRIPGGPLGRIRLAANCFPQKTLPKPISGDRAMRRLLYQYESHPPARNTHTRRVLCGTVWCARRCYFVSRPPARARTQTTGIPHEEASSAENQLPTSLPRQVLRRPSAVAPGRRERYLRDKQAEPSSDWAAKRAPSSSGGSVMKWDHSTDCLPVSMFFLVASAPLIEGCQTHNDSCFLFHQVLPATSTLAGLHST